MPPASGAVFVERAPAKVNLYLHVLGRRGDGYHLVDSLIVFAGVGDRVTVRPDDRLELEVCGPFAGALATARDDNLVLRAARALAAAAAHEPCARIELDKRLPVAAGIGGGSADAAAALRALTRLWRLDLAPPALAEVAAGLGADVPACLASRPVVAGGIGELLRPLPGPWPELHLVLANPGLALPTTQVFAGREGPYGKAAPLEAVPASAPDLAAALARRRNDLEPSARRLDPAIGEALAALAALPGCLLARLSGSGATCFGLFAAAAAARAAAAALAAARGDWWVAAAPVLTAKAPGESRP
jgi:4-diphosphocytidyl-2-C-methyl-D-erythritol kinase